MILPGFFVPDEPPVVLQPFPWGSDKEIPLRRNSIKSCGSIMVKIPK